MRASRPQAEALGERLDSLYRTFDHVESATDPVHIVRRYRDSEDREVVGFCAAALAFGRVASVLQSIEALLAVMGPHPAAFVRDSTVRHGTAGGSNRSCTAGSAGRDIVALLLILQRMLRESGSIEAFFLAGDDPRQPTSAARSTRSPRGRCKPTCVKPTADTAAERPASATSSRARPPAAPASG